LSDLKPHFKLRHGNKLLLTGLDLGEQGPTNLGATHSEKNFWFVIKRC